MLARSLPCLALALLGLTTLVCAQFSPTQLCAASLNAPALENEEGTEVQFSFATTDTTVFQVVYTFDFSVCTGVPIQGIRLTDVDTGANFACTPSTSTFTASNTFIATCGTTNGQMAGQGAFNTVANWDILIRIGTRPNILAYDVFFNVVNITPDPSPGARRRRRAIEAGEVLPSDFTCSSMEKACPVPGRPGLWECVDTAGDINACGGCPGTDESQDCAIIPNVNGVACIAGTCAIQSCARRHTLSADGASCVPSTTTRSSMRFRELAPGIQLLLDE